MSLNRLILGVVLSVAIATQAQEAKCPAYKGKTRLSGVVVFDGPPERRADLIPDISKGSGDHVYASWEVGYIFDRGRKLYLVCRFGGTEDKNITTVEVANKVERCIYRSHNGKPAEMICK